MHPLEIRREDVPGMRSISCLEKETVLLEKWYWRAAFCEGMSWAQRTAAAVTSACVSAQKASWSSLGYDRSPSSGFKPCVLAMT